MSCKPDVFSASEHARTKCGQRKIRLARETRGHSVVDTSVYYLYPPADCIVVHNNAAINVFKSSLKMKLRKAAKQHPWHMTHHTQRLLYQSSQVKVEVDNVHNC